MPLGVPAYKSFRWWMPHPHHSHNKITIVDWEDEAHGCPYLIASRFTIPLPDLVWNWELAPQQIVVASVWLHLA